MLTQLGNLSVNDFVNDYWQKRPLLIRNALSQIPQIDPNELAGYALDDDVESRLFLEQPDSAGDPLKSDWKMEVGPFTEETFAQLPESHWTLLVQAVDTLRPDIMQLKELFSFLPSWRIDDVMVSYASDQGSVGPHFDYYDVFLLQAQGRRTWHVGQTCNSTTPLRGDTDCRILTEFAPQESWVLEPGDILYIPPGVAHWGIAEGACATYSIGFRAPSHGDLLLDLCEDLASVWTPDNRYSDPDLKLRNNPGEILPEDVQRLQTLLKQISGDTNWLSDWFGRYVTRHPREGVTFDNPFPEGPILSPSARLACTTQFGRTQLFVNGLSFVCNEEIAHYLCRPHGAQPLQLDGFTTPNDLELIEELFSMEVFIEKD